LKRFRATFTDCGEVTTWTLYATDADAADSEFWDAVDEFGGPEGIRLISITADPGMTQRESAHLEAAQA
jgi:hypothetical protein